jgi:hypothetical protein
MGLYRRPHRGGLHREPAARLPVPVRPLRGRPRMLGRIFQESPRELGPYGPTRPSRAADDFGRISGIRNPHAVC